MPDFDGRLSDDEARIFLLEKLCIESREVDGRLELLRQIVLAFHASVPYNNLALLAMEPRERRVASPSEIKAAGLSCEGGLCYANNLFAKNLLLALGFNASLLGGKVANAADHTLVLVRDVERAGDRYLVDVGCGYPSFEPIPLNFKDDEDYECTFQHSFLEYRYVRQANQDLVVRQHRRGDLPRHPAAVAACPSEVEGGWKRFYDVSLGQDSPPDCLPKAIHDVCTDPAKGPFLTSLRAIRWVDGRAVAIKDDTLLEEREDGAMEATPIRTYTELEALLARHFAEVSAPSRSKGSLRWWSKDRAVGA